VDVEGDSEQIFMINICRADRGVHYMGVDCVEMAGALDRLPGSVYGQTVRLVTLFKRVDRGPMSHL
jgi:hypothetical protein